MVSVYLSVQAVPEKFFQSLPVPYGVICKRGGGGGGGGVSFLIFFFGNFDICDNYYPTNSFEDLNQGGQNPR